MNRMYFNCLKVRDIKKKCKTKIPYSLELYSCGLINSISKFQADSQRGGIIREARIIFQSGRKERAYFFNSLETCRRLQNTNFNAKANIFLYLTNVQTICTLRIFFQDNVQVLIEIDEIFDILIHLLLMSASSIFTAGVLLSISSQNSFKQPAQHFSLDIVATSQEQTKPAVQNYI